MNNTETRPAVAGTLAHLAHNPRPVNMGIPTNARTITPAEIDRMVAASRAAMRRAEAAGVTA